MTILYGNMHINHHSKMYHSRGFHRQLLPPLLWYPSHWHIQSTRFHYSSRPLSLEIHHHLQPGGPSPQYMLHLERKLQLTEKQQITVIIMLRPSIIYLYYDSTPIQYSYIQTLCQMGLFLYGNVLYIVMGTVPSIIGVAIR